MTRKTLTYWITAAIVLSAYLQTITAQAPPQKPFPPSFVPTSLESLVDNDAIDDQSLKEPQPSQIIWKSGNGQPPPKYQWFIGDRPITNGLTPYDSSRRDAVGLFITSQILVHHKFTWRDNGKKLRCVVVHDTLGPNDKKEVAINLGVQFAPSVSLQEDVQSSVKLRSSNGTEKLLTVQVFANPGPTVDWNIDGELIRDGDYGKDDQYKSRITKEVAPGKWEASLELECVDGYEKKPFTIIVSNKFGKSQFNLSVAFEGAGVKQADIPKKCSVGTAAKDVEEDEEDDDSSNLGLIILAIIIILIIILIIVGVVYARAKGLLCFKPQDEDFQSGLERVLENSDSENDTIPFWV